MAERLDLADPGVARELLAHRTFVRDLARRLLRDGASDEDVAQETVVRLLAAERRETTRPWLRTVARNLARRFGRVAQRRGDVEQQHARETRGAAPSTAEIAQRLELERRLTARVLALAPPARDVVLLHFFEGRTVPETAAQLGIPLETARTRLRRALEELRAGWNGEHGGERGGLAALALLVGSTPIPWSATPHAPSSAIPSSLPITGGALAMASITPVRAAIVVAVVASAVVVGEVLPRLRSSHAPTTVASTPTPAASSDVAAAAPAPVAGAAPSPLAIDRRKEAPLVAAAPTTGSLELNVRFARDHAPAAGVTMVARPNGDGRIACRRAATDDAGVVRFEGLRAGRVRVTGDRADPGTIATIRAGECTRLDLEIPLGLRIRGVAVDRDGAPVPDALVEFAPLAKTDCDAEILATTDEAGRFEVRDAPTACLVGARAAGFVASRLVFVTGQPGNDAETRLELGADGGSLDVEVVDRDGAPVVGAVVRAGRGETSGIAARNLGAPPLPALARTGSDGRVHLVGLSAGVQPIVACVPGLAPLVGECTIVAGRTASLRIALEPGASVRGAVRDGTGHALAGALVEFGTWSDFVHLCTRSADDGQFDLTGLPAGEAAITADADDLGRAKRTVRAVVGEVVECDLVVSRGLELSGRVVDEARAPVAGVMVTATGAGFSNALSDADGRFSLANFPEQGALRIAVEGDGIADASFDFVDRKAGELLLTVRRTALATAHLTGVVLGPDGHPVPNAQVAAIADPPSSSGTFEATDAQGRFLTTGLVPGAWRIQVWSAEYPDTTSAPFEVAANQTRDVGLVRLTEGGRVRIDLAGERRHVVLRAVAADRARAEYIDIADDATTGLSRTLAPGAYRLEVGGEDVAVQSMPFTVRAGVETPLLVEVRRGVRQCFTLALPTDVELPHGVMVSVERGGEVLDAGAVFVPRGAASVDDRSWLAPGDYVLKISGAGRSGSATFTVTGTEGAAVHVELK